MSSPTLKYRIKQVSKAKQSIYDMVSADPAFVKLLEDNGVYHSQDRNIKPHTCSFISKIVIDGAPVYFCGIKYLVSDYMLRAFNDVSSQDTNLEEEDQWRVSGALTLANSSYATDVKYYFFNCKHIDSSSATSVVTGIQDPTPTFPECNCYTPRGGITIASFDGAVRGNVPVMAKQPSTKTAVTLKPPDKISWDKSMEYKSTKKMPSDFTGEIATDITWKLTRKLPKNPERLGYIYLVLNARAVIAPCCWWAASTPIIFRTEYFRVIDLAVAKHAAGAYKGDIKPSASIGVSDSAEYIFEAGDYHTGEGAEIKNRLQGRNYDLSLPECGNNQRFIYVVDSKYIGQLVKGVDKGDEKAEDKCPEDVYHYNSDTLFKPKNCGYPDCNVRYTWGHVCNAGGAYSLSDGTACPYYESPVLGTKDSVFACKLENIYAGDSITGDLVLELMWYSKGGLPWSKEEWEKTWTVPYIWTTLSFNPKQELTTVYTDEEGNMKTGDPYYRSDVYAIKTSIDPQTGKIQREEPKLLPGGTRSKTEDIPDFPTFVYPFQAKSVGGIHIIWPIADYSILDLAKIISEGKDGANISEILEEIYNTPYYKVVWGKEGLYTQVLVNTSYGAYPGGLYCINTAFITGDWRTKIALLKEKLINPSVYYTELQVIMHEFWDALLKSQISGKDNILVHQPILKSYPSSKGLTVFQGVPLNPLFEENIILVFGFTNDNVIDSTFVKISPVIRRGYTYQKDISLATTWKAVWNGRPSIFMNEKYISENCKARNDEDDACFPYESDFEVGEDTVEGGLMEEEPVERCYVPHLLDDRHDFRDIDKYKDINTSSQTQDINLEIPEDSAVSEWSYFEVAHNKTDDWFYPSHSFSKIVKKVQVYEPTSGVVRLSGQKPNFSADNPPGTPLSNIGKWYPVSSCTNMIIIIIDPLIANRFNDFMIFNLTGQATYTLKGADGSDKEVTKLIKFIPVGYNQVNRVFPGWDPPYDASRWSSAGTCEKDDVTYDVWDIEEDIEILTLGEGDRHPWVFFARAVTEESEVKDWNDYKNTWSEVPDVNYTTLPAQDKVELWIDYAFIGGIKDYQDKDFRDWQDSGAAENSFNDTLEIPLYWNHPKAGVISTIFNIATYKETYNFDGYEEATVGRYDLASIWPYARMAMRDLEIKYVWRDTYNCFEIRDLTSTAGGEAYDGDSRAGDFANFSPSESGPVVFGERYRAAVTRGPSKKMTQVSTGDHDLGTEWQPRVFTNQVPTQTRTTYGDTGVMEMSKSSYSWLHKSPIVEASPVYGFPTDYDTAVSPPPQQGALYYPYTRSETYSVFFPTNKTYLWEFLDIYRNKFVGQDYFGCGRVRMVDACQTGGATYRVSRWVQWFSYAKERPTELRGSYRTRGPTFQLEYREYYEKENKTIFLRPYFQRNWITRKNSTEPVKGYNFSSNYYQWVLMLDRTEFAAPDTDPDTMRSYDKYSSEEERQFYIKTGCVNPEVPRSDSGSFQFADGYVPGSPTTTVAQDREAITEMERNVKSKMTRYERCYIYQQTSFGYNLPWSPYDSPPLFGNMGREAWMLDLCSLGSVMSWVPTDSPSSESPNVPSWWSAREPLGQLVETVCLLPPEPECSHVVSPLSGNSANPFYNYLFTDPDLMNEQAPKFSGEDFKETYKASDIRFLQWLDFDHYGEGGYRSDAGRFTLTPMSSGSPLISYTVGETSNGINTIAKTDLKGLETVSGSKIIIGDRYYGYPSPYNDARVFVGYKTVGDKQVYWAWPLSNRDELTRGKKLFRAYPDAMTNELTETTVEDQEIAAIPSIIVPPYVCNTLDKKTLEISGGPKLKEIPAKDPDGEPTKQKTTFLIISRSERLEGGSFKAPWVSLRKIENSDLGSIKPYINPSVYYTVSTSNQLEGTPAPNMLCETKTLENGRAYGLEVSYVNRKYVGKAYSLDGYDGSHSTFGSLVIKKKGALGSKVHTVQAVFMLNNMEGDIISASVSLNPAFENLPTQNATDRFNLFLTATSTPRTSGKSSSSFRYKLPVTQNPISLDTDLVFSSAFKLEFLFSLNCAGETFDKFPWGDEKTDTMLRDIVDKIELSVLRPGYCGEIIELEPPEFVVSSGDQSERDGIEYSFYEDMQSEWFKVKWNEYRREIKRKTDQWYSGFADAYDQENDKIPKASCFDRPCVEVPELPISRLKLEAWDKENQKREDKKKWTTGGIWTTRMAGPEWITRDTVYSRDFIWWPALPYKKGVLRMKGRYYNFDTQYKDEASTVLARRAADEEDKFNSHAYDFENNGFDTLLRNLSDWEEVGAEGRRQEALKGTYYKNYRGLTRSPSSSPSLETDPYSVQPRYPTMDSAITQTRNYSSIGSYNRKEFLYLDELGIDASAADKSTLDAWETMQETLFKEKLLPLAPDNTFMKATAIIPYYEWKALADLTGESLYKYFDDIDFLPLSFSELQELTDDVTINWKNWEWAEIASFSFRDEFKNRYQGDSAESLIVRECGKKWAYNQYGGISATECAETYTDYNCFDKVDTKWKKIDLPLPEAVSVARSEGEPDPWWRF